MATRGRPKAELVLTEEERDTLLRWARRPKSPQSLALRSKIVLACGEGETNGRVATELSCSPATVGKWRQRFVDKRLRGLADEHRSGVPRTITDDHVEAVVVKTLTEKPVDATHWSTRSLARATGMSQPTISRIWKAFGLKPWQEDTFRDDPEAMLAIHRVPVRHRIRVRTTNLAERGFEEERRRTKVIPRLMSEQSTMKLAFATMIRAADRWCRVSINDIERHQLRLLRVELGIDPPPANDDRSTSSRRNNRRTAA